MKIIFTLLFSLFIYFVSAQVSFQTGSAQLDTDLNVINTRANLDFGAFKAGLVLDYNIAENRIDFMRTSLKMASAEIYLALEISRLSRRSVDHIIAIYRENKHRGWGYIAKQAGIKPGSSEFHQLKNNASTKKDKGAGKSNGKSQGKGKKK
jgi:hypothetical protein